jgi:hypothetical protein
MKWIKRITWAMFIAGYLIMMFWMIDKTVAGNQDQWDGQTVGMVSPRPSRGD